MNKRRKVKQELSFFFFSYLRKKNWFLWLLFLHQKKKVVQGLRDSSPVDWSGLVSVSFFVFFSFLFRSSSHKKKIGGPIWSSVQRRSHPCMFLSFFVRTLADWCLFSSAEPHANSVFFSISGEQDFFVFTSLWFWI